jgi:hypothetical protein
LQGGKNLLTLDKIIEHARKMVGWQNERLMDPTPVGLNQSESIQHMGHFILLSTNKTEKIYFPTPCFFLPLVFIYALKPSFEKFR